MSAQTTGSCNAIVYAEDFERPEQMIKKFCKICKKDRVIAIYLEQTAYHMTRSQIRRQEKMRSKRRIEREERRRRNDNR